MAATEQQYARILDLKQKLMDIALELEGAAAPRAGFTELECLSLNRAVKSLHEADMDLVEFT